MFMLCVTYILLKVFGLIYIACELPFVIRIQHQLRNREMLEHKPWPSKFQETNLHFMIVPFMEPRTHYMIIKVVTTSKIA